MKPVILMVLLLSIISGCATPETTEEEVDASEIDWMIGAAATAEEVHPLLPGMMAASFNAQTADGSVFEFNASRRQKNSILIFYRGGWCPYCNRQLMDLREIDDELVSLGYDLFFISADRPGKLSEGSLSDDPPYTLLSDNEMDVAKAFGIAYKVDEETVARYKRGGLDIEDAAGYSHHLLPAPSVFLIDQDGLIQFQYTNPNYRVRVSRDILLSAARVYSSSADQKG